MGPNMLDRLLSHDLPRSRWLALRCCSSVLALAVAPFLFPGSKALSVAAKMLVFILLVASYDLLLGYTGIVSFAHTMFFGIGAYGVAIASTRMGPGWAAVLSGTRGGAGRCRWAVAADRPVLAAREGDLLRDDHAGRGHGVPDPGLAAVRLHRRRGRPDLQEPRVCCSPSFEPFDNRCWGGGRRQGCFTYYLLFVAVAAAVPGAAAHRQLALRPRAAGDPRERLPRRGDRLPHRGLPHLVQRAVGAVRHLAGALLALWLRYVGPDTTLSFEIMLDILLIVVIGGMGTMYGAVVGAALFVLAQNYLQDLLKLGASALEGVPVLSAAVTPDRWLLWLGVLFVLSVYHFPTGIVGRLRALPAAA
jgi:branched-chain amino acid transport system permease protein